MRTLVVFDVFGTIVGESAPLPPAPELAARLAAALDLGGDTAQSVLGELVGSLLAALSDPGAEQPESRALLGGILARHGVPAPPDRIDAAMWRMLGPDDGRYRLCVPAAEAMRAVARAGHTVRLMSICYLPGDLMWRLLRQLGVPDVVDAAQFSADGGVKKPDPRAFAEIGRGDFDRRIMVGDTPYNDTDPAAALGWDTVPVNPAAPDFGRLHTLLETGVPVTETPSAGSR